MKILAPGLLVVGSVWIGVLLIGYGMSAAEGWRPNALELLVIATLVAPGVLAIWGYDRLKRC